MRKIAIRIFTRALLLSLAMLGLMCFHCELSAELPAQGEVQQVKLPVRKRDRLESGDKITKGGYIFRQKDIPANILKKIKKNKNNKMNLIGESRTAQYFALATWSENEDRKKINSKYLISNRTGNAVKTIDTSWLGEHPSGINGWYLSEKGDFIWQNGAMYRFYGNEEKPIKQIVVKNESTKGIMVGNDDKFLIVCESNVEMFDLRGNELWKNKVNGKIEPQSLMTSENGRYFAFEVSRDNERSTVVMGIDGNVVREISNLWAGNIAISNDGKYLITAGGVRNLYTGKKEQSFNFGKLMPDMHDVKWYYPEEELNKMNVNLEKLKQIEKERNYTTSIMRMKDGKAVTVFEVKFIGQTRAIAISPDDKYLLLVFNESESRMLHKRPPKGHLIITDIEGKNIFRQTFDYPLSRAYFTKDGRGIRVQGGGEIIELGISGIEGATAE